MIGGALRSEDWRSAVETRKALIRSNKRYMN